MNSQRHQRSARRSRGAWEGLRQGRDAVRRQRSRRALPEEGAADTSKATRTSHARPSDRSRDERAGESAAGPAWESAISPNHNSIQISLRSTARFMRYLRILLLGLYTPECQDPQNELND